MALDEQDTTFNDDNTLGKIHEKLEHLRNLYNSGKPLFPRALLADLDNQINEGNEEVHIDDLDDVRHTYSLKVPSWCADFATTYRIGYNSIQNLTCVHPAFPEISLRDNAPVSICYTSCSEHHPRSCPEEVCKAFTRTLQAWRESDTCKTLQHHLTTIPIRSPIRKIIAFGLGTLSVLHDEYHSTRSHAQHAAIDTMVEALTKRGMNTSTSTATANDQNSKENEAPERKITCYAQDPAYNDIDRALLHSLDITPLDDPKGFLEIDESTLVFSVSPNVPVKQIVADVQWPAAMIWNTVSGTEKESLRWERQMRDGEVCWVVPFTTDPDSERVRKMVERYTSVSLRDSNEYFGDLTIYVR